MSDEEKKKKYTFEKVSATSNVNAPDTSLYQADYSRQQNLEEIKELEVCGLGPDPDGICGPKEKKPQHVYVSEEQKKKK